MLRTPGTGTSTQKLQTIKKQHFKVLKTLLIPSLETPKTQEPWAAALGGPARGRGGTRPPLEVPSHLKEMGAEPPLRATTNRS